MKTYKEHSIVYAKFDLTDVPKDTSGTVVHVYSESAYVVEFIVDGKNIVKTVLKDQISE